MQCNSYCASPGSSDQCPYVVQSFYIHVRLERRSWTPEAETRSRHGWRSALRAVSMPLLGVGERCPAPTSTGAKDTGVRGEQAAEVGFHGFYASARLAGSRLESTKLGQPDRHPQDRNDGPTPETHGDQGVAKSSGHVEVCKTLANEVTASISPHYGNSSD